MFEIGFALICARILHWGTTNWDWLVIVHPWNLCHGLGTDTNWKWKGRREGRGNWRKWKEGERMGGMSLPAGLIILASLPMESYMSQIVSTNTHSWWPTTSWFTRESASTAEFSWISMLASCWSMLSCSTKKALLGMPSPDISTITCLLRCKRPT